MKELEKTMKKRGFCLLLAIAICAGMLLGGCTMGASGDQSAKGGSSTITSSASGKKTTGNRLVGISMPTEKDGRWVKDAETMQSILEEKGYMVELAYAGNDSDVQIDQVKAMLDDDCGTIVVASVDSDALSDALSGWDTSSTTVIAYSVLVPDCDTVDYFIGIDSYTNGQIQAKYLVKKLGLKDAKKSFNLEIFHQSGNGSALYAFLGAMDVLNPYLEDSTLVIPSGNVTAEECGVADADQAADRLSHLLETTYADGKPLDAILCTDDTISVGVAQGLTDSYAGSVFPVISGCNCNPDSISLLMGGQLAITSVEVTGSMAEQAAKMADQAMSGKTVDQSEENPYDVPAYLYKPTEVTLKNYQKKLFDSGLFIKHKDGTISAAKDTGKEKDDGKEDSAAKTAKETQKK